MPEPIYIFGHKNPGKRHCSALAYEAYKHAIRQTEYRCVALTQCPHRCGQAPRTALLIGDVTPRVGNIMQTGAYRRSKAPVQCLS